MYSNLHPVIVYSIPSETGSAPSPAEAPKSKKKAEGGQPKPTFVRGPSPENQKRLDYILQRTTEEPGISSPVIAKELGISTLQTSQLTDRLVKAGKIVVHKIEGGVRTNYTPEAFKNRPKETPAST